MPPAFPANTTVRDAFNRANEGPPMTGWVDLVPGLKVVSNTCAGNIAGSNFTYLNTPFTASGDCDFFVSVSTLPLATQSVAVYARLNAAISGYAVAAAPVAGAGNDTWGVYRIDGGVSTLIGTSFTQELSVGNKIGIRCLGPEIAAWYHNGTSWSQLAVRTETTYDPIGVTWITAISATGTTFRLDDVSGGEIPAMAELTGTALAGITEDDLVAGGKTIVVTLTGDRLISN